MKYNTIQVTYSVLIKGEELTVVEDLHRYCGCPKHLKYWNKVRGWKE